MWNPEPFLPYFLHHHVKGFLSKHTALKVRYWSRKYTVCRRVHASFSLKILQAGTVKGVKQTLWLFALWSCLTGIPSLRLVKDWVCFRSVCVSACMHAGLHACLCICMHVCVHACVCQISGNQIFFECSGIWRHFVFQIMYFQIYSKLSFTQKTQNIKQHKELYK